MQKIPSTFLEIQIVLKVKGNLGDTVDREEQVALAGPTRPPRPPSPTCQGWPPLVLIDAPPILYLPSKEIFS